MERVFQEDHRMMDAVISFLKKYHIKLESFDELYIEKADQRIVATGALKGNVMKCIAIDKKAEVNVNQVISFLVNRAYEIGHNKLFIYTRPEAYKSFEYLGFIKITETENVVLMENSLKGFDDYLFNLRNMKQSGTQGAVVVNCNPFTLGHQYLIEYANRSCDHLHVFVVWEDSSTFPNEIRYDLVKKGISHLKNVTLHKGKDYIISSATFPSYFLKDDADVTKEHIKLDLTLFSRIAEALNITKRFIGEEPFNPVTRLYNQMMHQVLKHISIIEIPRLTQDKKCISASQVRHLLVDSDLDSVKSLVPITTFDYLDSFEGRKLIDRLVKKYNKNNLV